jgi:Cu/Ag efflux protein CusF
MKKKLCLWVAAAFLISCAAVFADDHKKEGKILSIDPDTRTMAVQSEKGDQWTLFWTYTTKIEDGLTFPELKPGDKIEFEYMEKDGKMWLTSIEREKKGENHKH